MFLCELLFFVFLLFWGEGVGVKRTSFLFVNFLFYAFSLCVFLSLIIVIIIPFLLFSHLLHSSPHPFPSPVPFVPASHNITNSAHLSRWDPGGTSHRVSSWLPLLDSISSASLRFPTDTITSGEFGSLVC